MDLDTQCISMGNACVHCGIAMPKTEDAPRKCPEINADISRETVKENSPYDYEAGEYEDPPADPCDRDGCENETAIAYVPYCSFDCEQLGFEDAFDKLVEL